MTSGPLPLIHTSLPQKLPRRAAWSRRIASGVLLTGVLLGTCWFATWKSAQQFQNSSFVTGYVLLGVVCFLAAFHFRKRFPAIPLMSSASWLQLHIYAGWFAIGTYFLHTGLRIPDGRFEQLLASLFLGTAASGVYGLVISRTIPSKLSGLRVETIFERIPQQRRQIVVEAESLALAGISETTVLAKVYEQQVATFLASARSPWYYLVPTGHQRRWLVAQLRDLHRYLSPARREECQRIELLVCQKDDLDYHAAMQGRLKLWLFVHIGLTYSLLLVAVCHAVLAHAFHGGAR